MSAHESLKSLVDNPDALARALHKGLDPDMECDPGTTLVTEVCQYANLRCLELLIDAGAALKCHLL